MIPKSAVICYVVGGLILLGVLYNVTRKDLEGDGLKESKTITSTVIGYDRVAACHIEYGPEWPNVHHRRHFECAKPIVFGLKIDRNKIFIPDPNIGIDNQNSKEATMRPYWETYVPDQSSGLGWLAATIPSWAEFVFAILLFFAGFYAHQRGTRFA